VSGLLTVTSATTPLSWVFSALGSCPSAKVTTLPLFVVRLTSTSSLLGRFEAPPLPGTSAVLSWVVVFHYAFSLNIPCFLFLLDLRRASYYRPVWLTAPRPHSPLIGPRVEMTGYSTSLLHLEVGVPRKVRPWFNSKSVCKRLCSSSL